MRLLRNVKSRHADNEKRDMTMRRIIDQTLKICGNGRSYLQHFLQDLSNRFKGSSLRASQTEWMDQPQQAIQNALARSRAGAAPSLDIDQCVLISPPTGFLRLLWSELWIPASRGEMETCRRIMSFVLTAPRSANAPPLLPVFMHVLVPSLITTIDQQHHQEQTMKIEFLMAVITSALTACLHLEWALQSIFGESPVMDQRSAIILRRFAKQLRSKKHSPTSEALCQRLRALPSFMVNFPTVATELGM
jgi:mediator of RNA polymerase II transcription subunit 5